MNFTSPAFAVLFGLVFAARLTIGRRKTEPSFVAVLIAASTVFYGWHVPSYLLILLFSAGTDYVAALLLDGTPAANRRRRRWILIVSLSVNLGILGFFKYAEFLVRTAFDAAGWIGSVPPPPELGIVLPMGISFYTFQSMSYTIDVWRGVLKPIRSFPQFYLFISFFPQLVAGPIVRGTEWRPQIYRPRRLRLAVFYEGVWLMICGFFLKMVCADNLATVVNAHWSEGAVGNGTTALVLALMFSGQIFADFAGYSSIARGLGLLLGFRFPLNFNAPYIATSFANFWQRWHMTLSRWLRDYLYVPLGGNRVSSSRTYVNLLLVMLLGGLWHGAAYRFLVWGALHGSALAIERALGLNRLRAGRARRPFGFAWFLVVQLVVLVGWVFFRTPTVSEGWHFVRNLLSLPGDAPPSWAAAGLFFIVPLVAHHVWTWGEERKLVDPLGAGGRTILATFMLIGIFLLRGRSSDFLYFQF